MYSKLTPLAFQAVYTQSTGLHLQLEDSYSNWHLGSKVIILSLPFIINYTFYYNFTIKQNRFKYTFSQIHKLNIDKWHVIIIQWNAKTYPQHWVHFYPFKRLNKVCIGISKRLTVTRSLSVWSLLWERDLLSPTWIHEVLPSFRYLNVSKHFYCNHLSSNHQHIAKLMQKHLHESLSVPPQSYFHQKA